MKKFKQAFIALSLLLIVGAGIYLFVGKEEVEYTQETPVPVTVEQVAELNKITEAQRQLNEAKRLLQEEETVKLAEIAEIQAKAEADVAEREARLQEIREVRLSFSQAPDQVN